MRERLTRRKKKTSDTAAQPAPPPLQPAYFDAEPGGDSEPDEAESSANREPMAPESTTRASSAHEAEPEIQSAPEDFAEPAPEEQSAPSTGQSQGQPKRGRRRRGGRGRGGRGREQAVAQAFTPAATKGIVPETPTDAQAADEPHDGEPEAAAPGDAAAISAVPAAPSRPPKGIVVLAIGLPGSGKSSWFKRHNVVPLSTDMVRTLLFDDVREQRFQDLVFSNLRAMLKARLIAKRPMNYVDATNLTPQERQHWIKLAKDYNYEVHAVFFDVPLDVCLERHQRRDRVVPDDVMRRMAAKLKAPSFTEGFAKITVVRVKKKDE